MGKFVPVLSIQMTVRLSQPGTPRSLHLTMIVPVVQEGVAGSMYLHALALHGLVLLSPQGKRILLVGNGALGQSICGLLWSSSWFS
jgi:hypothetical protein